MHRVLLGRQRCLPGLPAAVFYESEHWTSFAIWSCARRQAVIEKPLDHTKKPDMSEAPQSGRLIRPRLAGFEVIDDT
jgi:hypothetical protein